MTNQASKLTPAALQSAQLGPNVYRGDDGVDRVLGISSGLLPPSDQPAQEDEPYIVEVDENGCGSCGNGRTWTVVGPDGARHSESWGDEEEASHFAECMNDAYQRGTLALAPEPEVLTELVKLTKMGCEALHIKEQHPGEFGSCQYVVCAEYLRLAILAQRTPTAPGKRGK